MDNNKNSDESQKAPRRLKAGCDVGCQTDAIKPSAKPDVKAEKSWVANGNPAGVAGGSTGAPSKSSAFVAADEQKSAPAGVKPNSVAEYFADKQNAAPSANAKMRTSSTTGVVGEGKKCVRANTTSQQAGSSNTKGDGPSWADENCKLQLVINRFSHLDETMCSEAKLIEGVQWKIMVMPKQHLVQKKQQKCMGFFLQCSPEKAYSDTWSVHAIADMRMLSHDKNIPHFARRTTHTYTAKENDWGYSCFMTWADILDKNQGYIKDDTVVLEIAVKAEPPKNMMTYEEFVERIEKWIVLAEMQKSKGQIDLALEANQNAMKFCNGKDDDCFQKLTKQRETFVNAKLFESIERIEKGKTPTVATDTSHGKPTSLRQALTGAQKSLSGKMTAKGGKKTRAVVTVQHMKKKKPYEQNAQRTNNGGSSTVKDLVENRKNAKSEEAAKEKISKTGQEPDNKLLEDIAKSTESCEQKSAETSTPSSIYAEDGDHNTGEGYADEDDDEYDDDEVYNEGNYADQANDVTNAPYSQDGDSEMYERFDFPPETLAIINGCTEIDEQWHSSCEDLIKMSRRSSLSEYLPNYQGYNEDGVMMCDRKTQTMTAEAREIEKIMKENFDTNDETVETEVDTDSTTQTEHPPFKKTKEDGTAVKTRKKAEKKRDNRNMHEVQPYYNMMWSATPCERMELPPNPGMFTRWMEGDDPLLNCAPVDSGGPEMELAQRFANCKLDDFQQVLALGALSYDGFRASVDRENAYRPAFSDLVIKRLLNLEGALTDHLSPESILGRMSDVDQRQLLDEINERIAPLVVALDVDYRKSAYAAQNFMKHSQNLLEDAQKIVRDSECLRETIQEKVVPYLGSDSPKRSPDTRVKSPPTPAKEKTVTSAATSSTMKNSKGRPTVIAKRTIPPRNSMIKPASPVDMTKDLTLPELPPYSAEGGPQENSLSFVNMNNYMTSVIDNMKNAHARLRRVIWDFFGDEGLTKLLNDLNDAREMQVSKLDQETKKLSDRLDAMEGEKHKTEKILRESEQKVKFEEERNAKLSKELKDVRNQLKKAENRATKEENRATSLQVNLNDLDEKMKTLKKEHETLKKKTAEERARVKKEKERDTQTMRQQVAEISDRENERDQCKKELEECTKAKEKIEKERRNVAAQLAAMTERARAAEHSILDSRKASALEELKKKRKEAAAGYSETEQNLNRVRQASDKEVLRKSLAEWKAYSDRVDSLFKSVSHDYDVALDNVKNGSKTLAQIGEIKIPALDALPKLVKPPPVQVVAPSSAALAPTVIATPAAGVIGQQRTPVGNRAQAYSGNENVSTSNVSSCSTPARARTSRLPSPVASPSKNTTSTRPADEAPVSSLWSWNTIGNLSDLRPSTQTDTSSFGMDPLQRDIWANNGNAGGSINVDFLRPSASNLSSIGSNSSSSFLRQTSAQQSAQNQPQNRGMSSFRPYGDMWSQNAMSNFQMQQPTQQEQNYGMRMQNHGSGDHPSTAANNYGMNVASWRSQSVTNPVLNQQQQQPPNPQTHPAHLPYSHHQFFESN
ncbi:unnamed protein product [Caenorhabditis bovis]|uniref:MATH domain-containing protein n=1 Tax=Caenorhabditis bovis TaxID=2654633 RepID=A0A8S1EZ87_9PELO|nr:unnamed protein product [Caenorhabditis bovis]